MAVFPYGDQYEDLMETQNIPWANEFGHINKASFSLFNLTWSFLAYASENHEQTLNCCLPRSVTG